VLLELLLEVALSGRDACACLKNSPSVYIGLREAHVRIHQKYTSISQGIAIAGRFSDKMFVVQHSLF
jgi:hypothetical protein